MNAINERLKSALFKLHTYFRDDPFSFHYALTLVLSSLFSTHNNQCIIVGGQSAAYWLRTPVSADVDLVSEDNYTIFQHLIQIGFKRTPDYSFRFYHENTQALVELVDDHLNIAGIIPKEICKITPDKIQDSLVASLVEESAYILTVTDVFLTYVEASCDRSIWYDIS